MVEEEDKTLQKAEMQEALAISLHQPKIPPLHIQQHHSRSPL